MHFQNRDIFFQKVRLDGWIDCTGAAPRVLPETYVKIDLSLVWIILQISVRIRSEFAQKVRFFQFQSLSLPKNRVKKPQVCSFNFPSGFTQPCDILGQHFHFLYPAGPVLPDTAHNLVASSPVHRTARDKTG